MQSNAVGVQQVVEEALAKMYGAQIRIEGASRTDSGDQYRIWNAEVADVFAAETHAHVGQALDESVMHAAAQVLVGEHDFRAFTVASPEVSSTTRTVEEVTVRREREQISIDVVANGFLRYMVRRIAGSLIEIGRGKLDRGGLAASLEPAFSEARWTAPAKGLTLMDVRY
jgi:tRNA pseudouridine38-40 synthase